MRRWVAMILIAALAAVSFAGCSQEQQTEAEETTEGTMERAGRAVDEAVEEAGEAVEDAADETAEAIEGAGESVGDATSN